MITKTLKELLKTAKRKGYKFYYDDETTTTVDEILKNRPNLDEGGYAFGKQTETQIEIIKKRFIFDKHIGIVTTQPLKNSISIKITLKSTNE